MSDERRTRDCPGCGVAAGRPHERGCGQEACPSCGDRLMFCGCDAPEGDRLPWTGMPAGEQECCALGWFVRQAPGPGGWVVCGPAEVGAVPNLKRFARQYCWSRGQKKYVPRRRAAVR